MAEYIDRWALLEEFSKTKLYKLSGQFERLIRQAPSVDVAEVIHGEWTWKQGAAEDEYCCICSNCKSECYGYYDDEDDNYIYVRSEYCPRCGAKMDGGNGNA